MLTFDIILQSGETESEAIDFLRCFDFSGCEECENEFSLYTSDFIEEYQGINMYYNFAADYYFFSNY